MDKPPASEPGAEWAWTGLVVAAVGTAGSLWLSLGMGLEACALCFYQRAFMMAALGALAVGLLAGAGRTGVAAALALPAAAAGAAVAGSHVYLERIGRLECPLGVFGWGSAPEQSLGAFLPLTLMLLFDAVRGGRAAALRFAAAPAALVLGGLFAYGCIRGVPPPKLPTAPYPDYPPKVCRPPYRAD